MNTWILVMCSLSLLGVFAYFIFSQEQPITNYPPREGPIVAFGDSLVFGVGAPKGADFVTLLSSKIGETIIQAGVPGDTTVDGIARVNVILEHRPRMVILLLGGNDYLQRISREETFANLKQLIVRIQESGAMVVLLGVRGGVLTDGYDTRFEELAEEMHVVYVEDVLAGIFGNVTFMADGVHPNEAGYARIAEKVYREIEPVLR
jgi:acyl-CoA thioesterase I